MTDMNKINVEALENVAGGYEKHTVHNDAVSYANIRKAPGLDSKVFFTIKNGEQVITTGKKVKKDGPGLDSKVFFTIKNGEQVITTGKKVKKDGYVWYEIMLAGAYDTGWIAGSLIGF